MEAMGEAVDGADDFELADRLSALSGVPVPKAVEEIRSANVLHNTVVDADEMKRTVKEFLTKQ